MIWCGIAAHTVDIRRSRCLYNRGLKLKIVALYREDFHMKFRENLSNGSQFMKVEIHADSR